MLKLDCKWEDFGVEAPGAILRVTDAHAYDDDQMAFGLIAYASADDAAADRRWFNAGSRSAPFDASDPDLDAQAYAYLKTLPEFVGAADV